MGPRNGPLVLILILATIEALAANVDETSTQTKTGMASMVATLCDGSGSPNVYLTPDHGWQATDVGAKENSVRTKPCLDDKKDILKLCKLVYDKEDVRNIMEVENTIINHWPDRDGYKHSHNVTAYKCLVGAFESEALLVPQSCKFQHTKGPCGSLLYWKKEAMEMCKDMHMYERVYSILLPCTGRVAEFAGVEYVCCPQENIHNKAPTATPKPEKKAPQQVVLNEDAYSAYTQNDETFLGRYRNEHEKFLAAKGAMENRHRDQVTMMMKEWQEAREDIKKLKKTDKKAGEKLYDQVMMKFQKLYKGIEQTHEADKKQLVTLHLQHRQANLNKKKRVYLEQYMLDLQSPKTPNIHAIFKDLKDYIKVEEKDREHTFNHYLHVRDNDRDEARRIQPVALEHVKVIDERIQQSLDMLKKLPEYAKLILPKIEKFREPYMSTANQALETLTQPLEQAAPKEVPKVNTEVKTDASVNTNVDWETPVQVPEESDDSEDENETSDDDFDEETDEDEHVNFVGNENHFVAHAVENKHAFQEGHVLQTKEAHLQSATGSVFGIAIGSVAVFVIIVVAVIMLRKHSHRRPVTHGFVEVDPAASPEERHVANMQMNGYENPTYQYFELNSNQQNL